MLRHSIVAPRQPVVPLPVLPEQLALSRHVCPRGFVLVVGELPRAGAIPSRLMGLQAAPYRANAALSPTDVDQGSDLIQGVDAGPLGYPGEVLGGCLSEATADRHLQCLRNIARNG